MAIVRLPFLDEVLVLAATEYWTVPLPELLLPEVMVIQLELLEAVQPHPLDVETFTLPGPPVALNDWLDGEIE